MTAVTAARGGDFPDWMSPMLVKELRQGLRSKAFAGVFLATQILMLLCVGFSFLATAGNEVLQTRVVVDGFFWFLISLPLLLVMPLRALGAVQEEVQAKTLELVFLTRLTAFRIMLGKWAALNFQTLLLVCAVLPYVVLRYFFGSVDVAEDLRTLGLMLLGSAMLTAVLLAISPYKSRVLRTLVFLGMLASMQFLPVLILMAAGGGMIGSGRGLGWEFYVMLLILAPMVIWFGLESGASRIAPAAENHAFSKRLVGIVALLLLLVFALLDLLVSVAFVIAVVFLWIISVDGMTERPACLESLLRPFRRYGVVGKLAALIFLPGWATCLVYLSLVSTVMVMLAWWMDFLGDERSLTMALALPAMILFPSAVSQIIPPLRHQFLATFIGVQMLSCVAAVFSGSMSAAGVKNAQLWMAWNPTCTFFFSLAQIGSGNRGAEFLPGTVLMLAGSVIVLLLIALPWFRAVFSRLQAHS